MDEPTNADESAGAKNDLELLGRFRQFGDRDALGRLFQRHAGAAYRIARRFLKDPHEAEDAVQAAFLNVMQHAHQFQGRSEVKTWLISTVVNVCRTKHRTEQRRATREQHAAGTVTSDSPPKISTAELYEAALNGIEKLPEEYRLPVWMHYCEGLAFSDIAEALVISEPAARKQTHRGLEMLRGSLAAVGVTATVTALTASLSTAAAEAAPATLSVALNNLATAPFTPAAAMAAKSAVAHSAFALKAASVLVAASVAAALIAYSAGTKPSPIPPAIPAVAAAKPAPDDPLPAPAPAGPVTLAPAFAPSENLQAILKQEIALWLSHDYLREALAEIQLKLPRQVRLQFAATEQAMQTDWRGFDLDTEKISVGEALKKLSEKLQIKYALRGDHILFWREMPADQRAKYHKELQDKTQPLSARREAALDLLRSGDVNAVGDVLLQVLSRTDPEINAELFQPLRRTLAFGLVLPYGELLDPTTGSPYTLLSDDARIRTAALAWLGQTPDAFAAFATPAMTGDFNARLAALLNLPEPLLKLAPVDFHSNKTYFWALGFINDAACRVRLAQYMSGEGEDGPQAMLALAARSDPRALPLLLRVISGDDDMVAARAVKLTTHYPDGNGDGDITATLLRLALKGGTHRSEAATITLGKMNGLWKHAPHFKDIKSAMLPHVETAQTPQDLYYRATLALSELRDPALTTHFIAMLKEPHLPEMGPVMRALQNTRDPSIVEPLIEIGLNAATHQNTRRNAFEAVCGLRSRDAIAKLLAKAPAAPNEILHELFTALVHSHDPRAEEYVARAAAPGASQPSRAAAVQALMHTRSEEGFAALFAALKDPDDIVRVFAHGALSHIDCDASREYLCEAHLHKQPLLEVVASCCGSPGADAEKRRAYNAHLREMAEKAGIVESGVLMRALAQDLGTQATQDLLFRMLDHPHEYVRKHAAQILLTNERTYLIALAKVLGNAQADVKLRKRAAAVHLYAACRTEPTADNPIKFAESMPDEVKLREANTILMAAAEKDSEPIVRLAAVYSLHRERGKPEVMQTLRRIAQKETSPMVRTAASEALTKYFQPYSLLNNLENPDKIKVKQPETSTLEF